MKERTLITSAAALAAVGLLSLFLAYRHEPSAASSTAVPEVRETVGGTIVGSEGANTTEPEPEATVQQCQQAAYVAYSSTNIIDENVPPDPAPNELCVPISALRPDATIVGAFLTEDEACDYRDQHPGSTVRELQASTEPDPCG